MSIPTTRLKRIAGEFPVGGVTGIRRMGGGITNDTFLVNAANGVFILQRLHGIFKPEVLADTEAITTRLALRGMMTPRLVRTKRGTLGHIHDSGCWRMLTFVPGKCFQEALNVRQVHSAAVLLGRFHRNLDGMEYRFAHQLKGFHDTAQNMEHLERTLRESRGHESYPVLEPLARTVLDGYARTGTLTGLPVRIIHGDPKVSNVRFDRNGRHAVALLDLDTVGRNTVAVELGDAARSWCNRAREGEWRYARFNLVNFRAMVAGYVDAMDGTVSRDELCMVPIGVETIVLELAARFLTDAIRREYFKLESGRYRDLAEQNMVRARSQVRLYQDVISKRDAMARIVHKA